MDTTKKITVEVDGPRVRVNGQLVAETAVGVTEGRDILERNLDLHRIAGHVLRALDATHEATDGLTDDQADRFGAGFADGFRGRAEPHPMLEGVDGTGVPRQMADREFRAGWEAGKALRALRRHLSDRTEPAAA